MNKVYVDVLFHNIYEFEILDKFFNQHNNNNNMNSLVNAFKSFKLTYVLISNVDQ